MRNRIPGALAALMLLMAAGMVPHARAENPTFVRLTPTQIKALGIESREGSPAAGTLQGGFPGQITLPQDQVRILSLPFAARVETLYGAPGLTVKKGQRLFRLSVPQALELRRDREQALAANTLAQQALARDELLYQEGIIAQARLQSSRMAAAQAAALAAERQDALSTAGLIEMGQGLFELRAPMDGVILEQTVQTGQRLDASEPLARIGRMETLWVEGTVPASLAPSLRIGQPIEIPAVQAKGRLIAIGRSADASQSILLRARLDKGGKHLAAGQAVEMVIADLEASTAPLRLPASALIRQQGGHFVFVVDSSTVEGTTFKPLPVELVSQSGEEVLVRQIPAKSRVVSRGTSGLKAIWTGVGRE